ncbi:MAG: N-acetylmuramic acid 6-phosphate etherase [Granulicella sp.]
MSTLSQLLTEARNPASTHIDELPTLDMLRLINDEDATVAAAVAAELPPIARAVDAIAARFAQAGRLFYIGAGTSGRLGVLDASECPPTFSVPPTLFQGIIAGGDSALRTSSEQTEDSLSQGVTDLDARGFTPRDTLIGIAASGRTPYVLGAIAHARRLGALTIGLSCVPASPLAEAAEIAITPATGPEILTGSTRMKAGTATKLVLNMISTGVMIRSGATYGNLMVNMQTSNEKLVDRGHRIIMEATGIDQPAAAALLKQAGSIKTAIVMQKLALTRTEADHALAGTEGRLGPLLSQSEGSPHARTSLDCR